MGRPSLSVLVLVAAAANINSQECMLNSFPMYDSIRTDYGRFPRGILAVVPQYQFPCMRLVSQLTARVGIGDDVDGIFAVEIWRPTDINGSYTLLWGIQYPTMFETSRVGNLVTFSPPFAVPVERGDVIGFYSGSPHTESHQILYDPTARGITVYSTSRGGGPLCNFSICDDGVLPRANTAPLITATYESRMDIQVEFDRLDQFGISDRCYTTTFSTCSVLSTTLSLGAIQTPAPPLPLPLPPPLPTSTSGVGGPPLTSTTYVTHPITLSTASPGITLGTAATAGIVIARAVLVILMTAALLVLLAVRSRRYSPTAGDAIITEENEAYGARTQPEHIVTAANVAYGLTTQDEAYSDVSGGEVNTDTEGYVNTEEEYDYVNN